ncbi:ABC transporter ATP-binding protein [Microbacterium gilvum]|uniref:ABC transporter ATP-binding protein n=1 Tax=Microbacterium gilvum TaxID=1336204 RepID=A0ABP8ZUS8_9MICO
MTAILDVNDLTISYGDGAPALEAVSLSLGRGEVLAVVGESGSGKTTLARAVLGLLPGSASIAAGRIRFEELDLLASDQRQWRALRGRRLAYIPQDPATSLNPTRRVGAQVAETLIAHGLTDRRTAGRAAVKALQNAGLRDPERAARAWPHELSGGMRQRALIAGAFVGDPGLIIADEPTSALDTTVQRRVLDHLGGLVRERGTSMLLITHDLGVALERADRVAVMRRGHLIDVFAPDDLGVSELDPYVTELLDAVPSLAKAVHVEKIDRDPVLAVRGLVTRYRGGVTAVDGASFDVSRGMTTALVGESGSGKTTIARTVLGLIPASEGTIRFEGTDIDSLRGEERRQLRRRVQLVQQNPHSTFDPRIPIRRALAEPLKVFGLGTRQERQRRVDQLLDQVALARSLGDRLPHELSGGQLQRAAIARALALRPEVVVCDEPVSALDVSVQAQILRLLRELQDELGLTYLFITHDLGVVGEIAHDVVVLAAGRVVEHGPLASVFGTPQHEVTRELLAAAPGAPSARSLRDRPFGKEPA